MPVSTLRTFNASSTAYTYRLDEASYYLLMKNLHRQPETYPAHNRIWESGKARSQRIGLSSRADIAVAETQADEETTFHTGQPSFGTPIGHDLYPEMDGSAETVYVLPDPSTTASRCSKYPNTSRTRTRMQSAQGYGSIQSRHSFMLPYPASYTPRNSRCQLFLHHVSYGYVIAFLLLLVFLGLLFEKSFTWLCCTF